MEAADCGSALTKTSFRTTTVQRRDAMAGHICKGPSSGRIRRIQVADKADQSSQSSNLFDIAHMIDIFDTTKCDNPYCLGRLTLTGRYADTLIVWLLACQARPYLSLLSLIRTTPGSAPRSIAHSSQRLSTDNTHLAIFKVQCLHSVQNQCLCLLIRRSFNYPHLNGVAR